MKIPDILIFDNFVNYRDREGSWCIATIETIKKETEKYQEFLNSLFTR